jgi:hypothetical protein
VRTPLTVPRISVCRQGESGRSGLRAAVVMLPTAARFIVVVVVATGGVRTGDAPGRATWSSKTPTGVWEVGMASATAD